MTNSEIDFRTKNGILHLFAIVYNKNTNVIYSKNLKILMNNKNIILQQRDNTQNIQLALIVFMIAFSIVLIIITHVKDKRVIETTGNTEIQTATTTTTTTTTTSSIPATLNSQHSNTNSYVSNYFNAWELTKVI